MVFPVNYWHVALKLKDVVSGLREQYEINSKSSRVWDIPTYCSQYESSSQAVWRDGTHWSCG